MTQQNPHSNGLIKQEPEKEIQQHKKSFQIPDTKWWIIKDLSSNKVYFYDGRTKKTTWELPDNIMIEKFEEIENLKKQHKIEFNKTERPQKRSLTKQSNRIPKTDWWIIDDPAIPNIYFYNAAKNITEWELPEEVRKLRGQSNNLNQKENIDVSSSVKKNNEHLFSEQKINGNYKVTNLAQFIKPLNSDNGVSSNNSNFNLNIEKNNFEKKLRGYVSNSNVKQQLILPPWKKAMSENATIKKSISVGNFDLNKLNKIPNSTNFNLLNGTQNLLFQKKIWQQKYIDLQEKISLEELKKSNQNNLNVIKRTLYMSEKELVDSICKMVSTCSKLSLLSSLSITDLRQTLLFKTLLANKSTLEMIYLILSNKMYDETKNSRDIDSPVHSTYLADSSVSNESEKTKTMFCFFCSKRYSNKILLEKHVNSHSLPKNNRIKCHFCDADVWSEISLDIHMRTQHDYELNFLIEKKKELIKNKILEKNKKVKLTEENDQNILNSPNSIITNSDNIENKVSVEEVEEQKKN